MSAIQPLLTPTTKRVRILSDFEITALYSHPQLTEQERAWLFELNQQEEKVLTTKMSTPRKIDAILQLGYFKKMQQFFSFKWHEVQTDVDYIAQRYFETTPQALKTLGRNAKNYNKQWVLAITGYPSFSQIQHTPMLFAKAQELCRVSSDPVTIFRELLNFIAQQKITLPGYSTLQEHIISRALSHEKKRVSEILTQHLSEHERKELLTLCDKEDNFYTITLLKKQPKNFKPTAVRQEITYYEQYLPCYHIAKRILPELGISKNAIAYFASLIEHYTVQSLHRAKADQTYLWLLCFVYHRCQRMVDNMATMFIYNANQYQDDVTRHADQVLLSHGLTPEEKQQKVAKLIRFYTDETINDRQPFIKIKNAAFKIMPPERINQVAKEMEDSNLQKTLHTQLFWQAVDKFSDTYRPLLRALIKVLCIEGEQHKALQKAWYFLIDHLKTKKSLSKIAYHKFPIQFISIKDRAFICDDVKKTIHINRYEFECYRQISNYINGRSLFLSDSLDYQSLEATLLPDWEHSKANVIQQLNKPLLVQPLSHFIEEKAKPLDEKIILINEAINAGENFYIKVKRQKDGLSTWTLPYTKKSLDLNNPFYEKLPPISIAQILKFTNLHTDFMRQFTHIKSHYAKSKLDEMAVYACLIANGTNLGVIKMSSLCDLNLDSLNLTEKNYLRLSTLRAANDVVCNAIAKLPIFKYWNLQPEILHASLDGQKFKTEWDNLLARYSSKYFGFDKGVVAYSLIANHVPINATIIGANEHESRFLFDLIYNNTSEIQPDVFSTDTEGSNQLNFLLLHLIEKLYAPRYRSLGDKASTIISFSDPGNFKDYLIKPCRQINQNLILSEEDNIQHVMASL